MSGVRRVYLQHWSEYLLAGLLAAAPVLVAAVLDVAASGVGWSVAMGLGGLLLCRPHLVADEHGLSVTQIVGRRRRYGWDEVEAVTAGSAGMVGGVRYEACVVIRLRGRRGVDAVEDLPWLPTSLSWSWGPFREARRQHSLTVAEALQSRLASWRAAQEAGA